MFNLLSYFKKEDKPVVTMVAGLNLNDLLNYIKSKALSKTALEIGKYNLALLLKNNIEMRHTKDKDTIDYLALQNDLYVAYKVNEYLEHPDAFQSFTELGKCVFRDRYGAHELFAESKKVDLSKYARGEMKTLFEYFKAKYLTISMPQSLPDIRTGSGYYWRLSNLHLVIKDLFAQCTVKLSELKEKAEVVSSPKSK